MEMLCGFAGSIFKCSETLMNKIQHSHSKSHVIPHRPEIFMKEKDVFTLELGDMAIYLCDDIIYESIFRDFAQ